MRRTDRTEEVRDCQGKAEGRSVTAERPSNCFARVGPCKAVCAPPAGRVEPQPRKGAERGVGPFFAPEAPGGTEAKRQPRRSDRGNPEGSIFVRDKGRGSQAPLRPCHTAPQRGSVQGLPGFRTIPLRGGHIRASGLTSGVCLPANPRRKPVSAGLTVGITA